VISNLECTKRSRRGYWHIYITPTMPKSHFLGYARRYIRRPPISQSNILEVNENEVSYLAKDTKTKTLQEARCTPADFVACSLPMSWIDTGTPCVISGCWHHEQRG
jgi:hypothetical protein